MSQPSHTSFWQTLRPYWALLFLVGLLITQLLHPPDSVAATPRHYSELEFPPLPEVQLPDYDQFQLENGLRVYLIEDHELPLVSGVALVNTGSRLEPIDKVGLAGMTGALMRSGGTQSHPPESLNRELEQKAASIEASIDTTRGTVRFDALSADLETVFDLFVEVLRQPAFDPDQLALAKNQARGQIARRNDEPRDIAQREFQKLIYGEGSPYARTMEYETVAAIERQDLQQFYQQSVQPDRLILGLVGDFERGNMRALIEQKLGDWQASGSSFPDLSEELRQPSQAQTSGVFLVDRPELTQSYVELGHLGGVRNNPDYPILGVMNNVLSGFGGRLFNQVRSRQGLAYSVYGVWATQYDYPGVFRAGGQTRSEATVPFIESVRGEIERIRREPITADELQLAKDSTLNSFVFNFASRAQTLSRLLTYDYYDYPSDFLFRYQDRVKATTVEDVLRVAQTYLNPEQLVTLVVGDRAAIDPSLDRLNPNQDVTLIDVTIPQPS